MQSNPEAIIVTKCSSKSDESAVLDYIVDLIMRVRQTDGKKKFKVWVTVEEIKSNEPT